MRRSLRFAAPLPLLLVALALALGACGGGDERDAKNAYVRQVNAAQTEFATNVTNVSQRITPKSSAIQDRRTLKRFEAAIQEVVVTLEAIEVPSDVEVEHKQLVAAMSGFGTDIKRATSALSDPDTRTIAEAQRSIANATQTVNQRIDSAIAAINSKLAA
jgi:hypothetical protein